MRSVFRMTGNKLYASPKNFIFSPNRVTAWLPYILISLPDAAIWVLMVPQWKRKQTQFFSDASAGEHLNSRLLPHL